MVTFESPKSPVLLTISLQSLPYAKLPLNVYTKLNLENLIQSLPQFTLVKSTPTTLAGNNPAYKLVYTFASGLKTLAVFTIIGDKAYIIEYITKSTSEYSTYLSTVQEMINSFEILNNNKHETTMNQAANNSISTQQVRFLPYYNSTYGISIQYPSNWKKTEGNDIIAFSEPAKNALKEPQATLLVEVRRDLPYDRVTTLDSFVSEQRAYWKRSWPDFKLIGALGNTLGATLLIE